ncbi:hypothetical protein LSTR_LSTR000545 [Laodelphax striatellus]|uniref:EB domain-containing protein n=1 Tax=Laodelphax striatellus TaxID=195883 RepID=A0A482XGI7_LAOST|nr:hypothetical protein LSTR_LSTR000545 [Laodelphax striatellus]
MRRQFEEDPAMCLRDKDCARYIFCGDKGHLCRCQVWGECEVKRDYGSFCHASIQCDKGLVCIQRTCRCEWHERYDYAMAVCKPQYEMDDLPRFADLPDPDREAPEDIPATYSGPLLVAAISLSLVILCLALAAWCRLTAPRPQEHHCPAHHILSHCPAVNTYATFRNLESCSKQPSSLYSIELTSKSSAQIK